MTDDQIFRWLFVAVVATAFAISGFFRYQARQSGETIARVSEGKLNLAFRIVFAAPFYLAMLAYMINPAWMDWSSIPAPLWLRWIGNTLAVGMLPLLWWVMVSIGKNISETFLTKQNHQLVTHGPYRWVRHPLYSVATVLFLSLGIAAANWFIITMALIAFIGIAVYVVPKEEVELVRKFGRVYEDYQSRTGRFAPRLTAG